MDSVFRCGIFQNLFAFLAERVVEDVQNLKVEMENENRLLGGVGKRYKKRFRDDKFMPKKLFQDLTCVVTLRGTIEITKLLSFIFDINSQ